MKKIKGFNEFVNEANSIDTLHNITEGYRVEYISGSDNEKHTSGIYATKKEAEDKHWELTKIKDVKSIEVVKVGKLEENDNVNEAKTLDREDMMAWFKSKGRDFVKTSEEFNDEEDGIWLSRADNDKHIDQRSRSARFKGGVLHTFRKQTADRGWEITFYDNETVMVWPNHNANESNVDNSEHIASETVYHDKDFLGMQAQAVNMTREQWIAHYGTPTIGSGIE